MLNNMAFSMEGSGSHHALVDVENVENEKKHKHKLSK